MPAELTMRLFDPAPSDTGRRRVDRPPRNEQGEVFVKILYDTAQSRRRRNQFISPADENRAARETADFFRDK